MGIYNMTIKHWFNFSLVATILIASLIAIPMNTQSAYAVTATGGTITYSGGYTIHTFTTSGTFTVTQAGDVEYLVIGAGGGGGGADNQVAGGGGAGAFRTATGFAVTVQGYTITVGAGGSGGVGINDGGDGGDSTFSTITSNGGAGGQVQTSSGTSNGNASGSGAGWTGTTGGTGGAYGNDGGAGTGGGASNSAGGGGGSSGVGQIAQAGGLGGAGGSGTASSISGASVTYAGGGGGGSYGGGNSAGGSGGGGIGGDSVNGGTGTANTGSGGGGTGKTSPSNGGAGGSGIVIISYLTASPPDPVTDLTSTAIGSTTIDLDWTAPSAGTGTISGYQINATTPQTGNPLVWLNNTGSTNTDHVVTGLSANTDYSFRVSAWTEVGNDATGNVYNATTLNPVPSTPTNLVATASSISVIGLDWDDSIIPTIDNLTGYRIFSESPTGNGWTLEVNDTGISTSSYSDTGLTTKTQYNYMVAGINATGVGSNSTASSDYTWGVPDAPTLFTIITPTVSTLTLNWTSSVEYDYPVTGVEVWRDNILIATIGDLTTYLDSLLSAVTSYDYAIRSISSYGNSPFVNVTGTTVTSPPTSLTVLPDGVSTSNLNMTWVAPVPSTGVNGYLIEREAPVGGGFSTIVANTTTTDVTYQDTGLVINTYYNYRVSALTTDGASQVSNTYAQTTYHLPDAVTVLTATVDELITVDLAWDVPDTLYGYLDGYMINYTTPAGLPLTIETSDTGNSLTTYTMTGLTAGDVYSFSVSAITIHGKNVTSPLTAIANATAFSSFIIGELALSTDSNTNVIPIMFALESVDADTQDLVVTYDSSYALACSLIEQTSNTNNTYTGLTENAISGSSVYSNFTINDFSNDAIDVYCWDTLDATTEGTYLISSSGVGTDTFPLQNQILNFTAGIYGTDGKFGSIDLVTLFIVILSMIGFNRTNPAVGVGLMAAFIGIATYYQLLTYQGTMVAGIALVVMVAIIQVRKQT